MFGSGVPVLAVDFPTLGELVRDGENGLIFRNSDELTTGILRLLFPDNQDTVGSQLEELKRLQNGAKAIESWDDSWETIMKPHVLEIHARS